MCEEYVYGLCVCELVCVCVLRWCVYVVCVRSTVWGVCVRWGVCVYVEVVCVKSMCVGVCVVVVCVCCV